MIFGRAHGQPFEKLPFPILVLKLPDFKISYANLAAITAMESLADALPYDPKNVVGQSAESFLGDREDQRKQLSKPDSLPFRSKISLGGQVLDLVFSESADKKSVVLTWENVTAQHRAQEKDRQLGTMLDQMPVNVMVVDKNNHKITYANKTSVETLRQLKDLIPINADEIVGQSIDIFHKEPTRQHKLLADPANLPHKALIQLGSEKLHLRIERLDDADGNYVAPMLIWQVQSENERRAGEMVNEIGASVFKIDEFTEGVAAAGEELSATAQEIASQTTNSLKRAQAAMKDIDHSTKVITELQNAAEEITGVVDLISSIAEQTNLLALNATIEAARAGDAGKGFSVVASEVKTLAAQTGNATSDISQKVAAIRQSTNQVVNSIGDIRGGMESVLEMTTAVSAAVEEQAAASNEINRNMAGVAELSASVREKVECLGAGGTSA